MLFGAMIYPCKDRNLTVRQGYEFVVKTIVYLLENSLDIDSNLAVL